MSVPVWILDIFAAIMLLVAAVSAARLAVGGSWRRPATGADIDLAHVLMGIAMAGMLTSALSTLPDVVWEVIFGCLTAWFGWRVYQDARHRVAEPAGSGHYRPHLVHSAAMLYMFLALAAPAAAASGSGMSGMGGSSAAMTLQFPTLGLIFALVLAGYAVWDLDHLGRHYQFAGRGVRSGRGTPPGIPALATAAGPAAGQPAAATGPVQPATGVATSSESLATSAQATAIKPEPARENHATQPARDGGRATAWEKLLAPGVAVGCRIAMGITMALMLIIMI
jgi:hypothetical protein